MGIRGALPSAWRIFGTGLALGVWVAACSDEPRPRVSSPQAESPSFTPRRVEVSTATTSDTVIDARDLTRPGAGAVGSERAAREIGALPPDLLAILHDGPGGPVQDDDIDIELHIGLDQAGERFESDAPSLVDARVLAPAALPPAAPPDGSPLSGP